VSFYERYLRPLLITVWLRAAGSTRRRRHRCSRSRIAAQNV